MKVNNVYKVLLILCFAIISNTLIAQQQNITVKGIVLERISRQPVEFATVMITSGVDQKIISGLTTDSEGKFEAEVPKTDLVVTISFIGFVSRVFENIPTNESVADLGIILLLEDRETLDEVVVQAEKSTTEFKLDKRVFNVGKDLSNTGASALEILNNVPSVNVNIEGEISLRGSTGVQILINGKPSVLASEQGNALGSITADMIEKIEVITNPSAKYEAEGTSGIINIIIKKEERQGINGSVSLNTGTPHNHSVGLSINRRTEKFNLFSQLGVGYRELPRDNENINRDFQNDNSIISEGREFRNEFYYNVVLGTDYHINKHNVLTLSGNFAYEIEDQPSQYNYHLTDLAGASLAKWYRKETTEATNPKYRYELQYKKDFPDHKEHMLLFSALGNLFTKDQSSTFQETNITGSAARNDQETRTNFGETKYTFNFDYTKPFSDKITLETGAQYLLNDVSNDYEVLDLENSGWVQDTGLTNVFEYDQKVLGVYVTGAYEDDAWGLKLGLRVENTDLKTLLVNTNKKNDNNFSNFFPSVHTSYKVNERFSFQAGYSRRIFRPRLWDLNPFFNIRNNFSIRTGNPDLLPEFTDSYELASIYIFDKTSFNFGVYYRYTTDVVERVSTFKNNINTTQPENIGTKDAIGIEFNGKYSPNKWLTINGDFNYNYFKRQGSFQEQSFDFNADQWSGKATAKFKLPWQLDFEVTGQYQSKFKTIQGQTFSNLFADLGLRKKLMKGKTILNLSVRDIFASRRRESETSQEDFYFYSWGQRGRFITFGLSYGFGKGEAMEYGGQRRRH